MISLDDVHFALTNLGPQLKELCESMDEAGLKSELSALEKESEDPGFWNDAENNQKVLKRLKAVKEKLGHINSLKSSFDDLNVMYELAGEDAEIAAELETSLTAFETALDSAVTATMLSGEYDDHNAIMSFHAGAGGTEAQDWAQMLYRMYTRWAERHGFKYTILDYLDGDEAGIKSASILIDGTNAYGYLKSESGVHRLVRISPFDSSGRRHTSFAAIEVMPEIEDEVEIEIRDEDLRIDTYRSGGAGGQHVNKTESAVRITHIPTGVVTACQNERSQYQNKDVAMKMLRSKLAEIKEREHLSRIEDIKGGQKAIEWGSQIRSYVFMPYTLAKDHRTNFESGNIGAVMDGDLDGFINAYLKSKALGNI